MKTLRRTLCVLLLAVTLTVAFGTAPAGGTNIGNEGCTPGYWKNHPGNWEEYRPGSLLRFNFAIPAQLAAFRNDTFVDALNYKGGPGVEGGARILFRAAIAAYLNAAHEGVGYPYRRFRDPGHLELQINEALASLDRSRMIALAEWLDTANNLGCPLS